jgi:anaerobic ribonucleoside-triphosphate reductase activating protein
MFNIAQITSDSLMESDGLGLIVWFQGCHRNCRGCQNPELLPFKGGLSTGVEIFETYDLDWVDNFILLGGEPLDQSEGVLEIAQYAHSKGKKVWLYTGYMFEEINKYVLDNVDVVIDGSYMDIYTSDVIRFRGSLNQRVFFKENSEWVDRTNNIESKTMFNKAIVNIDKE